MTHPDDVAFPSGPYSGLTKREYFAGLAMQGILADWRSSSSEVFIDRDQSVIATWSVQYADALLAELEKETK